MSESAASHLRSVPAGAEVADLALLETAHRWMLTGRTMEDRLRAVFKQGRLRGRLLSGLGQEAIPVGVGLCAQDGDVLAPVHRDMAVHLIRGTSPADIYRHYLGRRTSLSRGRDGDVHMADWSKGVLPMVSHLPDSWPIIGGVALSFKLRHEARVAFAFCGDGATSTGTWHESVNFAAVQQLPIVYIVENNQYAYSTPNALQFRTERLADRAAGYGIDGVHVDGNDVLAVHQATTEAVARARSGGGPSLIEVETFRVEGHAIHDPAHYVPQEVRDEWLAKDPIDRAEALLRDHGWDDVRFAALRAELDAEMRAAWDEAEAEPLPDASELDDGVYA